MPRRTRFLFFAFVLTGAVAFAIAFLFFVPPLEEGGGPVGPSFFSIPFGTPMVIEQRGTEPHYPAVPKDGSAEEKGTSGASAHDFLSQNGTFEETGSPEKSEMTDWWLNSGAYFTMEDGIGQTIQGSLAEGDPWQRRFADYNASETDNGKHPQNIFRLVTKRKWRDFRQTAYFQVTRSIMSDDENRDSSNGLLLFNRYQDGNNLYYAGIRVDGFAVIKKKVNGKYFMLAYNQVLPETYARKTNPNVLPLHSWIGLRSEIQTESDGAVHLKLFFDAKREGKWELVAEAVDDGRMFGGAALQEPGSAGIRTDFMDVEFRDYQIEEFTETEKKQ